MKLFCYKLNISFKPFKFSSFYSRFLKYFTESFFGNIYPILFRKRQNFLFRIQNRLRMWNRKSIPRANILANITTKNPIVKLSFYFLRNVFFEFNSVIRNTFAAIYHIGRNNSLSWAGINTSCATSAMVSHGWVIVFEFDI